jgi:hypothetical protein
MLLTAQPIQVVVLAPRRRFVLVLSLVGGCFVRDDFCALRRVRSSAAESRGAANTKERGAGERLRRGHWP